MDGFIERKPTCISCQEKYLVLQSLVIFMGFPYYLIGFPWAIGMVASDKGTWYVSNDVQSSQYDKQDSRFVWPYDIPLIVMGLFNFRYVKSRSDQQLRDNSSADDVSDCKPEDTSNGLVIVPCGLIAWSLFNDTYNFSINSAQLNVNKKGISWKSDREHKFGKDVYPKNFQSGGLIGGAKLDPSIPVSLARISRLENYELHCRS